VYNVIVLGASSQRRVHLQLAKVLVTLPLGISSFSGLQMLDLPLVGRVQASTSDVIVVPYIGEVDQLGLLDANNVNIQPLSSDSNNTGFIIRGSVSITLESTSTYEHPEFGATSLFPMFQPDPGSGPAGPVGPNAATMSCIKQEQPFQRSPALREYMQPQAIFLELY
jgi:hypothetical protein